MCLPVCLKMYGYYRNKNIGILDLFYILLSFLFDQSLIIVERLSFQIQPYPTEESLQQKLQDMSNWEAFKTMTVTDYILFSKYVHDTLYL